MDHGDDTHTNVDFATVNSKFDAAVLRKSFFGNVQLCHDLQAADNRGLKVIDLGRCWLGVKDAVNSIPNDQAIGFEIRCECHSPAFGSLPTESH